MKVKGQFLWGVVAVLGAAWIIHLRGAETKAETPLRAEGTPIRVEVLNGSGIARAGLVVADELRARGFDVVDVKNADRSDYETTLVLDRVGHAEYATAVATAISAPPAVLQRNEDLLLEVSVVLGRDVALRERKAS